MGDREPAWIGLSIVDIGLRLQIVIDSSSSDESGDGNTIRDAILTCARKPT